MATEAGGVMKAQPISDLSGLNREEWWAETKLDGERARVNQDLHQTKIVNAAGNDITAQYPELRIADPNGAIELDGEIVMGNGTKADFNRLQHRMHLADSRKIAYLARTDPVTFIAFDVLSVDRRDITHKPLEARKEQLIVEMMTRHIYSNTHYKRLSPTCLADIPESILEQMKAAGYEGIMLKHRDSRYERGKRSPRWCKYKFLDDVDCVIVGYTEGTGWREQPDLFGALILGVFNKRGAIREIGKVGTGVNFNERGIREIKALLSDTGETERRGKDIIHWVNPTQTVTVKCLDITGDGRLRQPSLYRIRADKRPEECIMDDPHRKEVRDGRV
jgi:bifunctional non-homologous end joining protein LigD